MFIILNIYMQNVKYKKLSKWYAHYNIVLLKYTWIRKLRETDQISDFSPQNNYVY